MRSDEASVEEATKIVGQGARVRVPSRRLARHRLLGDRDELAGRTEAVIDRGRRLAEHGARHVGGVLAVIGRPPGEDFVEHGAERIHVGAPIDRRSACLLGRHVGRRPDDRAGGGHGGAPGRRVLIAWQLRRIDQLRETPIDDHGLAERADHDVAGLEIAVQHALLVRVADRFAHAEQRAYAWQPRCERGRVGEHLFERRAGDERHRVVGLARDPAAGLVDRDDARMLQARGDLRFPAKARLELGRGAPHQLDRDDATEPPIARTHQAPEPTFTDLRLDRVVVRVDRRQRVIALEVALAAECLLPGVGRALAHAEHRRRGASPRILWRDGPGHDLVGRADAKRARFGRRAWARARVRRGPAAARRAADRDAL